MFSYRDENETRRTPYVTIIIIALNALVWLVVERTGAPLVLARAVCDLGLIPGELTGTLPPGTPFPMGEGLVCIVDPARQVSHGFTSMFLHGSWMHLGPSPTFVATRTCGRRPGFQARKDRRQKPITELLE